MITLRSNLKYINTSCIHYLCAVYLTVIGSEDRIFFSSSAKDPEAKGAIPKSASERIKKTELLTLAYAPQEFCCRIQNSSPCTDCESEHGTDFETLS